MKVQYLEIKGDMAKLIQTIVNRKKSVLNSVSVLWKYGIEYLGDNRFVCINKNSKFYNKRCRVM